VASLSSNVANASRSPYQELEQRLERKKPWYIAIVLVVVGAIAAIATFIQNAEVVCSAIDTRVGINFVLQAA
jgi:hypothetical protein